MDVGSQLAVVEGEYGRNTGYLVAPDLLLTTRHGVIGADGQEPGWLKVRFLDEREKVLPAAVVWQSGGADADVDACLVKLESGTRAPKRTRWGDYDRVENVGWEATGFPEASHVLVDGSAVVDATGASGVIEAHDAEGRGLLGLTVQAGAPSSEMLWAGMSGAPVFAQGHLVGIVRGGHSNFGSGRLWATPVSRLLADDEFAALVRRPTPRLIPRSVLEEKIDRREPRSPAAMLLARHRVVRFCEPARAAELEELGDWCADEREALSIRLFTGPGGAGKTRLFIEWCERLRGLGWDAGFLPGVAGTGDVEADIGRLLGRKRKVFAVIDYAELYPRLHTVLDVMARSDIDGRCHVALLARNAGDWWGELPRQCDRAVADIVGRWQPRGLSPIALADGLREFVFRDAWTAYARFHGVEIAEPPVISLPVISLDDERFSRMLYIHMAALAAATPGEEAETQPVDGLLDATLDREAQVWVREQRARREPGRRDDARLLRGLGRAVAALTLRGGSRSEAETEAIVARAGVPAEFAGVLRDLYPGEPGEPGDGDVERDVAGLEPDLLGEALVARVLGHARTPDSYLDEVFGDADRTVLQTGFTVLGRVAVDRPGQAAGWIARVLDADVPGRAEAAFDAALAVGEYSAFSPLGRVLTTCLERAGTVNLARVLENRLPEHTVGLRELNCWVEETLLAALTPADDETAQSRRAELLNKLGARYCALGKREEAMQATFEAVEYYRVLADTHSDAFLPGLALGLNNLGESYSGLGKREEAMQATLEAVEHYRVLAKVHPDALFPHLAMSLSNLGLRYRELGKRLEAMQATLEAVEHYHVLAKVRPDAFLPDLARSLNNLGAIYSELGKREEAMQTTLEAVEHYHALADTRPDAFLPGLAESLHNLAGRCRELGKREEAMQAALEAVEIRRALADARSDAFLPDLAGSLNNLGVMYTELGKREEAMQTTLEAVKHYRVLVEARPGAFLPGLALSLNNLGSDLNEFGKQEEAVQATLEAVEYYRMLAEAHPEAFLPDLAMSLNSLGISYSNLRKREEAMQATLEAVEHYRVLAEAHPEAFLPNLAMSLNNLGLQYRDLERPREWLNVTREAIAIYTVLAQALPAVFTEKLVWSADSLTEGLRALDMNIEQFPELILALMLLHDLGA